VLTDGEFFQGSLDDLAAASGTVKIPCLRKDFILDPFQVLEARAYGADAILLIVSAHTDAALSDLRDEAHSLGLDVLCETHNREELNRAIQLGFDLIGVNSRDLRTFTVRPEVLLELAAGMPDGIVTVAESGIRTAEDIAKLREAGYDAFLVGEALMRQPDPGAASLCFFFGFSSRFLILVLLFFFLFLLAYVSVFSFWFGFFLLFAFGRVFFCSLSVFLVFFFVAILVFIFICFSVSASIIESVNLRALAMWDQICATPN